ncbi:Vegetative incompatibility protein HET-E-1 [Cytospora mali]|uniref:Vegetative incompatibility protein HET-E-1 n=1 Tax=Cytospora mali TaxID=578113 RepID=A0A194W2C6_CYTMA|nr:Vegetative incompatibility protein HET-E-1 [Valsa mali]
MSTARILTYGYHAHFSSKKEQTSLTINDFANDLLFRLKYDEDTEERVGQVPIIFVAHSMGGLVFKRAYVHGVMNEEYKDIISKIKAVLFLSTPHRGTDLADILNRVLSSSVFGHSPKDYVNELTKRSPTIDELNEQFRHHAAKLQIFSFYETLTTTVGPVKTLILEKHSSVLGYQHETPQPLVANHHDVCKFSSPEDPNYQSVKGALRSVVNSIRFSNEGNLDTEKDLSILRKWLGVTGIPEDSLSAIRSDRIPGTCEALLETPEFGEWLDSELRRPQMLWLNAPPGSGKTYQSSFVIDHIQSRNAKCVFWFFEYRDARKRSLKNMLRSIAYQIAIHDPSYRQTLLQLQRTGAQVAKGDSNAMWRNLLGSKLSKCQSRIYLVVDALDETDSSKTLLDLFASLGSVNTSMQILIVSRPLSNIRNSIQRLRKKAPDMFLTEMALTNNLEDIRLTAIEEMEDFPSDDDFKNEVITEVVSRSEGNFLWASLVLQRVIQCHRQDDVKRVLSSAPDGMNQLYERMVEAITGLGLEEDRTLSRILLSWAMFSTRPVSMEELKVPYSAELSSIIDLRHTVSKLCGEFATLDNQDCITLVHQTAREYLRTSNALPFSLNSSEVNEELLCQCLTSLCDPTLKAKIRQGKTPSFLAYAAVSWHVHLERSSIHSERVLQMLVKFFYDSALLTWIQYLAIKNNLPALVSVSASLSTFVRKRRKVDSSKPPMLHRIPEMALIEAWAADLLKITAKFGSYLLDDPEAIYKYIPSLSPHNSMLYKSHSSKSSSQISVSGLSSADWDDCLSRVSNGSDSCLHIAVSAQHLAVANDSPDGSVRLFSNVIFQDHISLKAGEPICSITFSPSGTLLACHGLDHTYIWKVEDGLLVTKVANPSQERAEALAFRPQEQFIIIATDMRRVYQLCIDSTDQNPSWTGLNPSLLEEASIPEGALINSPSSLAFNPDCTQLAVAYKGFPLSIWNLNPPEMVARCSVRRQNQRRIAGTTWTGVSRVVWHPFNGQVLGIYRDGQIFKWGPMDDTHEEVKQELDATPSEIAVAQNGLVFATSDVRGTIKIYDFVHMSPMYKLTGEDIIMAVAFSPDSKRFYDLRGSYCNVWEPSCLTRLVESGGTEHQDDSESVTSSEFRERSAETIIDLDDTQSIVTSMATSEAHADSRPAITAVMTARDNQRLVLYGKDDGTVEIYDTGRQKSHVLAQSAYGMAMGYIVLSPKGDFAACSLLNGKVLVKSVKISPKSGKLITKEIFTEKSDVDRGIVNQILFHSELRKLLVRGSSKVGVVSFETEDVATITEKTLASELQATQIARWEDHPTDPNTLLAFTASCIEAYSWDNLERPKYAIPIDLFAGNGRLTSVLPEASCIAIEFVVPSSPGKAHLAIVSFEEANNKVFSFVLLDTSPLYQENSDAAASTILPIDLSDNVADKIEQPVGFLEDGRLVFLDEALWVCTTRLRPGASDGVKRHFFVPRDWLNSAGLGMCRVQPDGMFLCPSKGELAVVRGNLGMDWG